MKKLILMIFVASFISSVNYAQSDLLLVSNSLNARAFNFPVNDLNVKAVRHFRHEFATVENENWFKIADGYTAKFTLGDVQYRVGYDKKGNWINTVRIYHEGQMPANMRTLVKSNYYDYAITLVEEVTVRKQTVYIVHIENEAGFKKLNIADGEMTVLEEHEK